MRLYLTLVIEDALPKLLTKFVNVSSHHIQGKLTWLGESCDPALMLVGYWPIPNLRHLYLSQFSGSYENILMLLWENRSSLRSVEFRDVRIQSKRQMFEGRRLAKRIQGIFRVFDRKLKQFQMIHLDCGPDPTRDWTGFKMWLD